MLQVILEPVKYSRTRIKETRIKETFGYKKRFHSSDFMQVKLSTLIGQLIKETMDKRNPFLTAQWVSFIRVWLYFEFSPFHWIHCRRKIGK